MVISSLAAGGAEKVMSMMANYWAERGHDISVLTIASPREDFFTLNPGVQRIALDQMTESRSVFQAIRNNLQRVVWIRRKLQTVLPQIVVSFVDKTNVLTLLAALGLNLPVVISERTNPRFHQIGWGWQWLRRAFYSKASAVVVQSEGVLSWAKRNHVNRRVVKIPNPIAECTLRHHRSERRGRTVLSIGRLGPEKGFDFLLRAFALCLNHTSEWRLVICGEGPERSRLENLAKELGINHKVFLPGQVKDSEAILGDADLFVLSSRFEGFPNVLLEAMACGLPVISFNCPSGPSEIIQDNSNGILVPAGDVASLATAMDRLMRDGRERKRLGENAILVKEKFGLEKTMGMWEGLLLTILQ